MKLSHLNNNIVKCGFPCSSLDKYLNLFKIHNLNVEIIDLENRVLYGLKEYKHKQCIIELLEFITSVDIDNLSITEAYKFIEDLKIKVSEINIDGEII